MIDTNVLRLNNLQRTVNPLLPFDTVKNPMMYGDLLRFFLRNVQSKVKEGDWELDPNIEDRKLLLKVSEYHNTFSKGESKTVWATGKVMTSSHYELGFRLPLGVNAPFVELNFSVPKLIYGTNIIQFVQHKSEARANPPFSLRYNNQVRYNAEQTYERYLHFLKIFFYRLNGFKWIDLHDLEIRRLDLCQVQMFNDKEDSMRYIKYQGDKVKKYSRKDSNKPRCYGTTVFFHTRDYGAKIYHKGDEYKGLTGEKNKHKEINRKRGSKIGGYWQDANIFNTNKLQEFSDKMLRYEISFRNASMSKIYRSKVWRKKNSWHISQMKRYDVLKRVYTYSTAKFVGEVGTLAYEHSKERINKYIDIWNGFKLVTHFCSTCFEKRKANLKYEWKDCLACWHEKIPVGYRLKDGTLMYITKPDRNFYFWWTKKKNKTLVFTFEVDDITRDIESGDQLLYDPEDGLDYAPDCAKFSKALFMEMYFELMKFKDEFRVERTSSFTEAQRKVEHFNSIAVKYGHSKVNIQNIKKLFALKNQYTDAQIVNYGFYTPESWSRIKRKLKAVDLNFEQGSSTGIKNDRTLEWYHRALLLDKELERYTDNTYFN